VITATGQAGGTVLEVRSPYSGEIVGILSRSNAAAVDRALAAAEADERRLATTITAPQAEHHVDAFADDSRLAGILRLCAEEALPVLGGLLPMDAAPQSVGRLGFVTLKRAGIELSDHQLVVVHPGDNG
jgi:hypothetical protein